MDSLTQIVLGAACGEAVLGKKIGNKALFFGAIGGTIPDLDVFIGKLLYSNEIDAMLYHRGFMHSILFATLGAFLFGWVTYKFYDSGKRLGSTKIRDWILLFFWALLTHPILDCFTPYGTQIFAPFSNYRVAFNTIAVADPMYTLPFLICMIVLMFFRRTSEKRKLWLRMGVGISSVYMLFTVGNKFYIDSIFKKSLTENNIEYYRYSTQPSILNNILWYGIAETETSYQVAFYSLLDKNNSFSEWQELPKTKAIYDINSSDLDRLMWFSNNFYNIKKSGKGNYIYKDLRYPLVKTKTGYRSVFSLELFEDNNRLNMKAFEPKTEDLNTALSELLKRLKGI